MSVTGVQQLCRSHGDNALLQVAMTPSSSPHGYTYRLTTPRSVGRVRTSSWNSSKEKPMDPIRIVVVTDRARNETYSLDPDDVARILSVAPHATIEDEFYMGDGDWEFFVRDHGPITPAKMLLKLVKGLDDAAVETLGGAIFERIMPTQNASGGWPEGGPFDDGCYGDD